MTDVSKDEEVLKIGYKVIKGFYKKYGIGTKRKLTKYFDEAEEYACLKGKYTKEELEDIIKKISVM